MQHFDWTSVLADGLTELSPAERPKIKADYERSTTWFPEQPGFGLREYASGRQVYIVKFQTPTGDRTITIGNANVVDKATALDVARRCIYHSDPGRNVADERKRLAARRCSRISSATTGK
jgi:hypothetical protein